MKSSKILLAAVATAVLITSCATKSRVECTIKDAPESTVSVFLLDVNRFQLLDTVKTDAKGKFTYSLSVEKGKPEFLYFYRGEKRVGSVILKAGDKVKIEADTLGKYTASGSEETVKLHEVESAEAAFNSQFATLVGSLQNLDVNSAESKKIQQEINRKYIDYYRSRVKYIIENPTALAVIPVLYQTVGDGLPVFGQMTDAIHFRNAADTLSTLYPDSKYVKALSEEAARRVNLMTMNSRFTDASEVAFLDIEMPDINGKPAKLSDVKAKVVMVYFWASGDAAQKMFNLEVIKPIYEQYKSKGLEIYAINLDVDKAVWAKSVKGQNAEWINVCDGLGLASPSIALYNVSSIPTVYFIVDGEIDGNANVSDAASLKRYLGSKLNF